MRYVKVVLMWSQARALISGGSLGASQAELELDQVPLYLRTTYYLHLTLSPV